MNLTLSAPHKLLEAAILMLALALAMVLSMANTAPALPF